MPTPRHRLGVTRAADGRIFAVGGKDTTGVSTAVVEIYDPAANSWSVGPSLPTALSIVGAATGYDGKVYAFSGSAEGNYVYNAANNSWSTLAAPSAENSRSTMTYVPVGHRIAAVGGPDATSVVFYDIDTNTWSSGPAYPAKRSAPAGTVDSSGALLMIGGFDSQTGSFTSMTSVYQLAPGASTWQTGPSLPNGVGLAAATTDSTGRVVLIAGQRTGYFQPPSTYTADVSVLVGNDWTPLAPLLEPRVSMGVCAGPGGKLYSIGGLAPGPNNATFPVGNVEIFTP